MSLSGEQQRTADSALEDLLYRIDKARKAREQTVDLCSELIKTGNLSTAGEAAVRLLRATAATEPWMTLDYRASNLPKSRVKILHEMRAEYTQYLLDPYALRPAGQVEDAYNNELRRAKARFLDETARIAAALLVDED